MATEYGQNIKRGSRVELSPACDLWMQGARFGTVISLDQDGFALVKMDHPQVKKRQTIHVQDLRRA